MNEDNLFKHFDFPANHGQQVVHIDHNSIHPFTMPMVHQSHFPDTLELTHRIAQELHQNALSTFSLSPHFSHLPLMQPPQLSEKSGISLSQQHQRLIAPTPHPAMESFTTTQVPTQNQPKPKRIRKPKKKTETIKVPKTTTKTIAKALSKSSESSTGPVDRGYTNLMPSNFKNLLPYPYEVKPRALRTSFPEMAKVERGARSVDNCVDKAARKALKLKRAAEREELRNQLKAIQENRYRPVFYYQPATQVVFSDPSVEATTFNGRFRKIVPKDPSFVTDNV
ncbi:hypothetical protein K502DRAFT_362392 [Neoconidiobolus thromboides FSU 785]|nr:hypothetical protein K502DRAFT_362392 [Neoconidiobolus thromboides FSU 785]